MQSSFRGLMCSCLLCSYPERKREWGHFHQAQVDIDNPDFTQFPEYSQATCIDVELTSGDILFIPKLWWHYVRTIENSIAVNFWFQHIGSEVLKLNRFWPHIFDCAVLFA